MMKPMTETRQHPASFRDPAGFIFEYQGQYYRQVNHSYKADYRHLIDSGLYQHLVQKKWLVPHKEINDFPLKKENAYLYILPEQLRIISYPYEWCFGQLRDAALLTLRIMRHSLEKGMILKDASGFNIQFEGNKPVFIDTLSFEIYKPGSPWIGYRQFCEHFLFPLLLEHYRKTDSIRWLQIYPNGIPVEITSSLLPWHCRLKPATLMHVFMQNWAKHKKNNTVSKASFSLAKMKYLLQHLEDIIGSLQPGKLVTSTWNNYYPSTILGKEYLIAKEKVLLQMLPDIDPCVVLDMGANEGHFALLMARAGHQVIACDADAVCIENLYQKIKKEKIRNLLPLVIDVSAPSPALGWANEERPAFNKRIQPQLILALALVHHLAIGQNLPLPMLAQYFARQAPQLIIEFVPKSDPKVQLLLQHRPDIFDGYSLPAFEIAFSAFFEVEQKETIPGTERVLYKMCRKM